MKNIKLTCSISLIFHLLLVSILAVSTVPEKQEPDSLIKFVSKDEYIVLTGKEAKENEYNENDFYYIKGIYTKENGVGITKYPLPDKGMLVQYGSDGQVNKIYVSKKDADHFDVIKDEEEITLPIEEKPEEESPTEQDNQSHKEDSQTQAENNKIQEQIAQPTKESHDYLFMASIIGLTGICLFLCTIINQKMKK